MKIFIINKEKFHNRPPVISTLLNLVELGCEVTLITVDINDHWSNNLKEKNVNLYIIPEDSKNGMFNKLLEYYNFRKKVDVFLRDNYMTGDIIWIIGGNTIRSLGENVIKRHKYVLQIQELHNDEKYFFSLLRKILNGASALILNEYNRSILYKCWFNLKERPFVLPNKPYFVPSAAQMTNYREKYKDALETIKDKKVILYQGHIGGDRDLTAFAQASQELGDNYRLVCVGPDHNVMKNYRAIDPNIVHIPHMPAPDYLVFTSVAYVGIVSYRANCLNNCYCAPNKIWEYAAFGLPMLCNDIPGLKYTVETAGAGCCIDEFDKDSIIRAIRKIDVHYESFKSATKEFYLSVDNSEVLRSIIMKIGL